MKIYIAGAITDNPYYKKQFADAEAYLVGKGFEVINPTKNECTTYKEYIDTGLAQLKTCDGIFMLPDWEWSKGANLELNYARTVGLKVFDYEAI